FPELLADALVAFSCKWNLLLLCHGFLKLNTLMGRNVSRFTVSIPNTILANGQDRCRHTKRLIWPVGVPVEGYYSNSNVASISTEIPFGSEPIPMADRVCRPASPSTSTSTSEQPLITRGCFPNNGSAFTIPKTLSTFVTRSSDPRASLSIASTCSQ